MYLDMKNGETYLIKLNLAFFSSLLYLGLILCYLCVIIFLCVNS